MKASSTTRGGLSAHAAVLHQSQRLETIKPIIFYNSLGIFMSISEQK